jgi:hypothetical protein
MENPYEPPTDGPTKPNESIDLPRTRSERFNRKLIWQTVLLVAVIAVILLIRAGTTMPVWFIVIAIALLVIVLLQ